MLLVPSPVATEAESSVREIGDARENQEHNRQRDHRVEPGQFGDQPVTGWEKDGNDEARETVARRLQEDCAMLLVDRESFEDGHKWRSACSVAVRR